MLIKESYIIFGAMLWKMRWWLVPCILVLLIGAVIETKQDNRKRKRRVRSTK